MPTYNAVGITATLTVADLKTSLSNVFDLKQGAEQQADAERINKVFAAGRNLPERAIGADGSNKGVQQFLGLHEDLPFFMVEVGNSVGESKRTNNLAVTQEESESFTKELDPGMESQSSDSSLSPLGQTPSDGALHKYDQKPLDPGTPHPRPNSQDEIDPAKVIRPAPFAGFEQARTHLDRKSGPEALCLTMDICHKTFLRRGERNRATGKDLKLEIFLNGDLAAITFINRRGTAVEIYKDKVYVHGMRIHRQLEKPWVYDPSPSNSAHGISAVDRWAAIGENLKIEAAARGRNQWGDDAPSTELLRSLSNLQLPECVNDAQGMSVIDLVVTAGGGKKDGPEAGYVTGPERLREPHFSIFNPTTVEDPSSDNMFHLEKAAEEASPLRLDFAATPVRDTSTVSPVKETPTKRGLSGALPQTPSKQMTADLALGLDLDKVKLTKIVGSFETSRGKGSGRRTLKQRLGDLRQMSPQNRAKHLVALREELGETAFCALKKESFEGEQTQPSPTKKLRFDATPPARCNFNLDVAENTGLPDYHTIEPTKLSQSIYGQPLPYYLPHSVDQDAMLTQDRVDMALDAGCESNGPLISRIASTSPQHYTPRITRASALANSPCSIPVKASPHKGRQPKTPRKCDDDAGVLGTPDGSCMALDPALTASGSPPSKSPWRGAARTRHAWNPTEKTAQQALQVFRPPESAVGGVVCYPRDVKVQRQIGKARNGEFREESLLVGMRFVVV